MEAVTKKIMCDKHGEYEAKMIMFGSKGIQSSQCPKCAAIRLEEERNAEAEKAKFWAASANRHHQVACAWKDAIVLHALGLCHQYRILTLSCSE